MTKPLFAAMLTSAMVCAQPALAPPSLGFIQDAAHGLRPVYGVAGNFILGTPVVENAVNAAFGGSFGLRKTASSLEAFGADGQLLASFDTAPGPALFAFSADGTQALAYISAAHSLVEFDGKTFQLVTLGRQVSGVLALAFPTANQAALFVREADARTFADGSATLLQMTLPLDGDGTASQCVLMGVRAPLLALPSGDLVYRGDAGIAIRRKDGSEVHLAASLPPRFALQQMNKDWVQLLDPASNTHFAIRTTAGSESLYRLPETLSAPGGSERFAR